MPVKRHFKKKLNGIEASKYLDGACIFWAAQKSGLPSFPTQDSPFNPQGSAGTFWTANMWHQKQQEEEEPEPPNLC